VIRSVVLGALAFVAMEPVTAATHRFVMHGPGRVLHRSHHRSAVGGTTGWELNDLFPLAFAIVVMMAMAVGFNVAGFGVLVPIGVGVTAYGVIYALVHDVYIHRRLPLFRNRTVPGLERLAAAHREHHRLNAAPYGMLVPLSQRREATGTSANGSRPSQVPLQP
jgi:beta-carotene 3-hydroxylase